jgi:predicted ATPase/DNA-binding SARP family transcriptional activator
MNDGKVVYRQQIARCGKPRCRKCREGIGHGPYWYAYRTENGITTRTYIGKRLPPEAQALVESGQTQENGSLPTTLILTSTGLNHASVRLFTLGQFRLERRRGQQWLPVTDAAWQEQALRTLLGYLVSSPARSVRRRYAIAALWPDLDLEMANEQLDRCVEALSLLLEPARPARGRSGQPAPSLLRSEGESLFLAEQARVWVDADAFEYLAARTETGDERRALLEEAARLYCGDFLPEERHLRVVISRRRALQSRWIALLLDLAELRIAQRAIPAAIDTLNLLLTHDPLNEAAAQLLILALARSQRRGEALRTYQRLAELLQREYDSVPSERTRALYEAVLRGDDSILREADDNGGIGNAVDETGKNEDTREEGGAGLRPGSPPTTFLTMPVTSLSANGEPSPANHGHNSSAGDGLSVGRTHQSPLVGRERELETLHGLLYQVERYAQAREQHGAPDIPLDTQRTAQCVMLMGEAGIGKTRLAEEVSREAQRRGWTVLWSRIYAQERGIPYRLWTEVLRKALDQGVWQEEEISNQPSLYQPLVALLPEMETAQGGSPVPSALSRLSLEQEQSRLWDAVYQLLATASETTPLVIVLDDVQWADVGSCQLLAHLARRIHSRPILLISTCRENELAENDSSLRHLIAEMLREHSIMMLDLAPLTSEQIGILVSHIPNLPESMLRHIQDRAAGNPFFAEELARTTPPTLPRTIAAALDHRLSRLSDLCRLLLGNAAILGGSFEFPVISALGMERSGEQVDEDTLLDVLDEALRAGVLTEEGTGAHISYHFWHPLLVSHLYESISLTRRVRLHRRAADVLREMHSGRQEEVAATITHHLLQGRAEPALIAFYAEMAGDRAYLLSVYSEAERYYRQAVEAMEEVQKARGRGTQESDWQDDAAHFISLLERLAECAMILGNFEEGRALYERILTLRHRYPAADTRYEAQVRSLLWGEIERTWRYTGDQARVRECSERSEQVLREADVQDGPAWAKLRYQQSSHYWQEGRYEEASQAALEALHLFERESEKNAVLSMQPASRLTRIQRILVGDPVEPGRIYTLLGNIAMGAGKRGEALSYLKRALAIYEQYDQKRGIAHVSCNLGYIHLKKGEFELALSFLHRSLDLAGRLGDAPLSSVVFSNLGELSALSGNLPQAEQWYKKALTLTEGFNDREYMSRWNACLASVLQAQGRLDEAATCAVRALHIGRAMHNAPCIGLALLTLANLRIAQARLCSNKQAKRRAKLLAHAQRHIQRALNLAGLEAETRTRALLALAETYQLLARARKAQTLLTQVMEEACRYELISVEQEARKLLHR